MPGSESSNVGKIIIKQHVLPHHVADRPYNKHQTREQLVAARHLCTYEQDMHAEDA